MMRKVLYGYQQTKVRLQAFSHTLIASKHVTGQKPVSPWENVAEAC